MFAAGYHIDPGAVRIGIAGMGGHGGTVYRSQLPYQDAGAVIELGSNPIKIRRGWRSASPPDQETKDKNRNRRTQENPHCLHTLTPFGIFLAAPLIS